jgi:hypothetical protein
MKINLVMRGVCEERFEGLKIGEWKLAIHVTIP